jgi:hypothetical protein
LATELKKILLWGLGSVKQCVLLTLKEPLASNALHGAWFLFCNARLAVLLSISSLLTDANPDDPLVPDAATMFATITPFHVLSTEIQTITSFACTETTVPYSTKRRRNGLKSMRNKPRRCFLCSELKPCAPLCEWREFYNERVLF